MDKKNNGNLVKFKVPRNNNFVVIGNHYIRDKNLSLKAIGLLTIILSLLDDWDFSLNGLVKIRKEGIDAIRSAIRELEDKGYLQKTAIRNENGRFGKTEYEVSETPRFKNGSGDGICQK